MVTICADGFNGAASARSRKCALNLALYVAGVASMGPRARARGNRPILLDFPHRCSFWLQWGRERALAEMNLAAGQRLHGIFASMGPRARARGNGFRPGGNGLNRHASMGPRARARGNTMATSLSSIAMRASMGPRARARGNTVTSESFGVLIRLQWGRERALAEMPSSSTAAAWVGFASRGPRARARGNSLPHTLFNFQRP